MRLYQRGGRRGGGVLLQTLHLGDRNSRGHARYPRSSGARLQIPLVPLYFGMAVPAVFDGSEFVEVDMSGVLLTLRAAAAEEFGPRRLN